MAKTTLAQGERYLKQLDGTLTEINTLRHNMSAALSAINLKVCEAQDVLNTSWSKVTELVVVLECYKVMLQEAGLD